MKSENESESSCQGNLVNFGLKLDILDISNEGYFRLLMHDKFDCRLFYQKLLLTKLFKQFP